MEAVFNGRFLWKQHIRPCHLFRPRFDLQLLENDLFKEEGGQQQVTNMSWKERLQQLLAKHKWGADSSFTYADILQRIFQRQAER